MIPYLEQSWRWFGPADRVTLSDIRQAGATSVVTALHHVACGEVWTIDEIQERRSEIEAAGLRWGVVESVPVHEDVKRRTGEHERYLDNYCQSLRNLGACGVRVVCYNFMAVTDWTRTNLSMRLPSGAIALRFDQIGAAAFDLFELRREGAEKAYSDDVRAKAAERWRGMSTEQREMLAGAILMGLPGTVGNLSVEEFRVRLRQYAQVDSDRLREHHVAFLRRVIPVAEEAGVVLAIHPDDPPFPMFGLPRIAGDEAGLRRIIEAVDSPANGITFCSGSLGANAENDLPGILDRLGHRVHFLHLRSVQREADGSFYEADHLAGSTDMTAIMRAAIRLLERRGEPLPMRPDHGHLMLDDLNADAFYPGYSKLGRMKGLAELRGLEMGVRAGMHQIWQVSPELAARFTSTFGEHCQFEEARVPAYSLPPVLPDRSITAKTWPARREEIVELYRTNVFGRGPGKPDSIRFDVIETDPNAMNGAATLKRIEIRSTRGAAMHRFELSLFLPNAVKIPAPTLLLINIRDRALADPTRREKTEIWPAEAIIARGYATATFQISDLAPDNTKTWRDGVARLFDGDGDDFGAIAAWAWGASRCADCLVQEPRVDAGKLAVIGHSRGGKTALWTGATDERFAISISNESGCGGASLARRRFGETPAVMNGYFTHWFNAAYKVHSKDVDGMPFDQHFLIASIAPRAVYVSSAGDDLWADPRGEFQALAEASPAFRLFGDPQISPDAMPPLERQLVVGRRGYHIRPGEHALTRYDWDRFMDFADRIFR